MVDKNNVMIQLNPRFQRKIFSDLVRKYRGSIKASKNVGIPASSIRGYKNLNFKSIPKRLMDTLIILKIVDPNELENNTISVFNKEDMIEEILSEGREKRKENLKRLRKDIPKLKELICSNHIDVSKWFEKYKALVESGFRKIEIQSRKDYLLISYNNFTKGGFKNFRIKIPKRFVLDEEFIYFFGLWCGDRCGGKRMGVCNKDASINQFVENFLKEKHQKIEKILYIGDKENEPKVRYNKRFSTGNKKGWALSVHSNNGILASFFHYLHSHLSEFLSIINYKNIFFAGLFDAEGNISLYNRSFRLACQNKELVDIYSKFLKELRLYDRYDGNCIISYDKDNFYHQIFPYLKNKEKINKMRLLCTGEGDLPKKYLKLLKFIRNRPGKTSKEISKALKKDSIYTELKLLKDFKFIKSEGYPYKFKIIKKEVE